jgi:hypothetical protein
MDTDIHASSGIRTHDPSVWAGEDSSCLRLSGHCGRVRHTNEILIREVEVTAGSLVI